MANDVSERITQYLTAGGLFNPEYMDHDKVRNLIMDAREELDRLHQRDGFIEILNEQILDKDEKIKRLQQALNDIHAMANNFPFVTSRPIRDYIKCTLKELDND